MWSICHMSPCAYDCCYRNNNVNERTKFVSSRKQDSTYPVAVEELYGPQNIKLSCHEELYGHVPGQRRDSMLTCPLVDLLQELLCGLETQQHHIHGMAHHGIQISYNELRNDRIFIIILDLRSLLWMTNVFAKRRFIYRQIRFSP